MLSKFAKFGVQHHNAIAKDIRDELVIYTSAYNSVSGDDDGVRKVVQCQIDAIVKLAVRFAKRFVDDNPSFDPLKFLDACSPNTDLYPLSELWDEYTRTS